MSTRRNVTTALLGLPVIAQSITLKNRAIQPLSEEAARIISYTLYAEARGEPLPGIRAVAAVIQTRARLHNSSLTDVCMKERQFSCWNEIEDVPEFFRTGAGMQPADVRARGDCYSIAWVLMYSSREWGRFTHFYNPDLASPEWAGQLRGKKTIGKHIFGYIN